MTTPDATGLPFERRLMLSPPEVSDVDRKALLAAFDSGWIAPVGPNLDEFEAAMAQRSARRHAVGVTSGTAALHLALLVAGIGPDDRVVVSDLTFAASANAVRYVGAEPVFVDVDPDTWNIDPDRFAEAVAAAEADGRPIRAAIVVDLYGQVADFDELLVTAAAHDIVVIEDAAEALGATYRGRPAGSFGDFGVFSFNGNKIITTSGGGMLATDRAEWAQRVRYLATQARQPVLHYEHTEVGFNYRLSNLLAALGTSQLQSLDDRLTRRRAVNARYRDLLADVPGVRFMADAGTGEPNWWLTALTIDPAAFGTDRQHVIEHLAAHRAEARPVWKPMHRQPVYRDATFVGSDVSGRLFDNGLCLPSGFGMTDADVDLVASLVLRARPGS